MIMDRKKFLDFARTKKVVTWKEAIEFVEQNCYVEAEPRTKDLLKGLIDDGKIERIKYGHYRAVNNPKQEKENA